MVPIKHFVLCLFAGCHRAQRSNGSTWTYGKLFLKFLLLVFTVSTEPVNAQKPSDSNKLPGAAPCR